MKPHRWTIPIVASIVALTGVSCSEPAGTDVTGPAFLASPIERHMILCKDGSDASFDITNGDVPNITLANGECESIAFHPGDNSVIPVTVNETNIPVGFVLDHVTIEHLNAAGTLLFSHDETGPAVTDTLRDDQARRITYYNINIAAANGRMTGGNNIRVGSLRVTGGLEIHCDITLSNNIEVNWPGGNNWHLDKPITSAICINDPNIDPVPPDAPFDTFIGTAIGSLNGVDGSFMSFTFVDDGEPGTSDHATINIWAPGADPSTDPPVFSVSDFLTHGNIQAHYDQPHK
jgi:hypothetical protein